IYYVKGEYERARDYLEQSLRIQQQIGDRKGEGTTLNNLATTAHAKGDYDRALEYLEQSLRIAQQIGDIDGVATCQTNKAVILYKQKKQTEAAIPLFLEAYQIFHKIGSPNEKVPLSYLNRIIEEIGEERFQAIIQKLQNP
ncbi:MAG: tetratricopeptide repeat protein, partial [Bacteroidetes bacterium]|nr:tetratricopeptide repeat protein [Bacteroidota bacterium]